MEIRFIDRQELIDYYLDKASKAEPLSKEVRMLLKDLSN